MELLFVGFSSLDLVKKSDKTDRIVECKDIRKIDNYIDNRRRILFINSSSDSNVDKIKVNNFIRNVKKTFSTKIVVITDDAENHQNFPYGTLNLHKTANESGEEVCINFNRKVKEALNPIVGESFHIKKIRRMVFDMVFSDPHVLIFGETGTGKNLLANAIHNASMRSGKMISLNLTTLPESLLESELFGHVKGAYTGADASREGLIGQADKGHFFLDEIGELSVAIQAKLLNVIEDGKYYVVGGSGSREIDIRFISATNRESTFLRRDLLFRLSEEMIELLPLRNRKEDIPLLVDFFFKQLDCKIKFADLPKEAQEKLMTYSYPGNIRELQNIIKRYVSSGTINLPISTVNMRKNAHFSKSNKYKFIDDPVNDIVESSIKNKMIMPLLDFKDKISSKFEAEYVSRVLRNFKWDKHLTARQLGISYRYLNKLIKKYSMDRRAKS